MRVSGRELINWLERAAGAFARLTPGRTDQPLLNPEFPSYNFDVLYGLNYDIDPTRPSRFGPHGHARARRVRNLRYQGRPIHPDQMFIVATNSFRSSGAGHFFSPQVTHLDLGPQTTTRERIIAMAEREGGFAPADDDVWRLVAPCGTSAWFDTSPRAKGRLSEAFTHRDSPPLGSASNAVPSPVAQGLLHRSWSATPAPSDQPFQASLPPTYPQVEEIGLTYEGFLRLRLVF